MERKVTSGVMWSLLLMSTLTLAFNIQPPKAGPYETRLHVTESPSGSWVPGVPVGGWVWLTVDIESPIAWDNTPDGIVGWTFSVKVDPDVLEVNNAYAASFGYFLFDFIDLNYPGQGHDPVILIEQIDPTTGVMKGIGELIFGFEMLGVGAGGISNATSDYGSTYGLCRLRFQSKNETAYTRIDIYDASWVDLNGTKHAFDVVDDAHYNEPRVHVGVKAGDWIKMNYTVTGSGITYPKWIKVEILGVEGTNVTVRLTMHMPDGTESSENLTLELAETFHYDTGGTLDTLFGFGFVIPANLTVGEGARTYITLLFPKRFFLGYEINGEITRTYAGADRAVVYTAYDYIGGRYGNDPLTCYWDKQTGVIVEASATLDGMTVNAKITETNMWAAAPEEEIPFWMQWWFFAIVAVAIGALAGAVYFLKKRKPPTPTAPTPPTEDTEISIE